MSQQANGDSAAPVDPPRCASRGDVDRLHGKRVRVEGRYEVDPVPGGKKLQAATIVLDDGTRLIRSYRPVPAELGFDDRRVIVVGKVFRDAGQPRHMQQVMAPHIYPERVDLAPGEKAIEPTPLELAPPPLVRSSAELQVRDRRWVRVQGTPTLAPEVEASDENWVTPKLRLSDGQWLELHQLSRSKWRKLQGQPVTAFGRVDMAGSRATSDGGRIHRLVAVDACAGLVERWPGGR